MEKKIKFYFKKNKFYGSPISMTSQFYFCPVPFRMDTYSGCSHNCLYCFANNSNQKYISDKNYKGKNFSFFVTTAKLSSIKNYLDIAFEGKKNNLSNQEAIAIELLQRRVPIHFGGMSDPCFLSGTKILSWNKKKIPIEKIKVGNKIVSFDETKKEFVKNNVIKIFKHNTKNRIYKIKIGVETLFVTENHPIYTSNGWKEVKNLKVGDKILLNAKSYQSSTNTIIRGNKE